MSLPTPRQAVKINIALVEFDRLIAAEMQYSEDLRRTEYLAMLRKNRATIQRMLETGKGLPQCLSTATV